MKKKIVNLFVAGILAVGSMTACGSSDGTVTLTNVSYDPTRELYEAYNEIFAEHWKEKTGEEDAGDA